MSRLVQAIDTFRSTGDAADLCAEIPYLRFMGARFSVDDGVVLAHMPYGEHVVGNAAIPALHGGSLGALLEATAIMQLFWEAEALIVPKTITLTVDYLRSAGPIDTFARCEITKKGRRVVNVHATAWQDDPGRPVASAVAHFLVAG